MKIFQLKNHDWWNIENEHRKRRRRRKRRRGRRKRRRRRPPVCRHSPEAGQRDDGLVEPPGGDEVLPDWVGGVIPPGGLETKSLSPVFPTGGSSGCRGCSGGGGGGGVSQGRLTWMSPAAGCLRFSKCFCLCCSWTFRAKPDPRIPCSHTNAASRTTRWG